MFGRFKKNILPVNTGTTTEPILPRVGTGEEIQQEISQGSKQRTTPDTSCKICDIPLFTIRWYPSNRGSVKTTSRSHKPQQMPPLMVRKAEWRR
jgi:hypothetical protein